MSAKLNSWLLKEKLYLSFQANVSTKNTLGFHSSVNPNTYAYNTSRAIPCYNEDGSLYFYDTYNRYYRDWGNYIYYNILNEMGETGQSRTSEFNIFTDEFGMEYLGWIEI